MNAELLKETLTQIGPLVTHARDGRQALKILEGERFDLIMLDIMMPDMSGFEIIKKIKANPKTVDLPVIFVSALDKTSDIVKGFDLGSYQYIVKPFNVEELKARVKSTLKIKDLQDQLSSEKKVLDLIFQFSTDGIVLLNSNFEILSCNEAFLKWIQRKKEEVFQKNFFQVFKCESNGQNPENYFMNRVDKLSHFDFDLTAVLENGKKFLHVNCSPIFSSLVVIEGYILVIRDVTTFREIDAQKETFVATLSHDLKTPIRAQIKAINLLLGKKYGNLNDFQEDILSETLNSNKFMFNMLDNLLTTYKYENGSVRMYKQNYDVNSLIMDCIRELKYLLDDKNLQLIFSFEEKNLEAFIDIIEFKRVIINLLSNAINYTNEKGKIIIKTEKRDFESVISFIDNGRGMSEEEIGKVFSRYSSYAKKFRQVGTGLGLYLSKQIVEKHGGKISVESQEGKGSIFKIILQ
jgi:PAS domain S-box-containing protein